MKTYPRYDAYLKALKAAEAIDAKKLAEGILKKVVVECLKQYQQRLNVGIEDSVSDLLENFKQQMTGSLLAMSPHWNVATARGGHLFPRNCRFFYTKGQRTVCILEEPPQVRTLSFDAALWGGLSQRVLYALALPYVVFIVCLDEQQLQTVYCGWRNRALGSLDEMLYAPVLPNHHRDLQVCRGHNIPLGENISQIVENVVADYWASTFNHDLLDFWNLRIGLSRYFSTPMTWADKSLEDSTFVLNLPYKGIETINHYIRLLTMYQEEVDEEGALVNGVKEAVLHSTEELFKGIMRHLQGTKFDRYYPKDIEEEVATAYRFVSTEFSTAILSLEHELQNFEEIKQKRDPYQWEPRGQFWSCSNLGNETKSKTEEKK